MTDQINSIVSIILWFAVIAILLILPLVLTILNIINFCRKRKYKPNILDDLMLFGQQPSAVIKAFTIETQCLPVMQGLL